MAKQEEKAKVIEYYDQEAEQYSSLYKHSLMDQEYYPANSIRLEIILDRLKESGGKKVLDVGCGSGQPLLRMLKEGFDACGFDFSPKMVECTRVALVNEGHDASRVSQGDVEVDESMPAGLFDAVVATGVFPHNLNDQAAYANIRKRIAKGGVAFIEYRNALMSMYSVNSFSSSFFWDELLRGEELPQALRDDTLAFLASKFDTTVEGIGKARDIEYTQILARFHNPLTLGDELAVHGLQLVDIHYYHYHVAPPHLEKKHRDEFREASLAMERKQDWRGMFLCSAYVAEIEHA